ncbi:MAG TPA: SpaA isopeptide-forming pilin-related protein, partial [Tissierellaceae bacterium]
RFVPDSLEAYVYYFDSKSPSPIIGNLIPKSDYKFAIHEDGLGYSIYFDNLKERVMLKYDSELHGKARKIYSNQLTTSKNEHYEADVEHKTYDKFINKKGKFDKVYAGEVLDWELTVNESYSDLKNVTITDTISGGHKYIDGSSKVINRFGKEIENAKLTINEVGNLQILKWELENVYDEFKITYNTLVTGNDQETISNKVTISSEEEDIQTNNDYENIEIHQVGWGTGNGEVPKDRKDLKLIKVDEDGNKITIDSAEFKIFRLVGNEEIPQENYFSEDNNDKFIFKTKDAEVLARGLNPGEYVIREVKAPKNHMLNEEDIYITINEEDNLIEKEIINKSYPDAVGKLEIVKIDAEDEKLLLEGAEFEILDLEGKLIDTLVTDKNGYAYKELPYGQYIIKEVRAPKGYLVSNVERPVTINGNKASKKLIVTNIKEESPKGKIRILKVDSEYNLKEKEFIPLLKGAEFEIKDLKGKVIAKLVTDENGYAETTLDYGEYKITEVKAPEGYESLDKDLLVEVDGSRNMIPILVKNTREENPEKPSIPGKPVEPENTEKPGKPGEVVDPEQPVEKPGKPTTPPKDKPNKPLVPVVPVEPSYPEGTISWVEIEPSNKGPEKEPNKPESGLDKPEITNNKPSKPKEEIKELLPKTGYEDNKFVSILGIILLIIGLYSLTNNKKRH